MSDRFAVLLRGVNVGKGNRVPMADFRVLLGSLGFTDVRTLLNSGNAVFRATAAQARHADARIERALSETLGVRSRVTVLSAAEVQRLVDGHPWRDEALDPSKLMLSVLADASVAARLAPLQAQSWAPERMVVGTREVYLWCPNGLSGSALITPFARVLGDAVTTRNWATMGKLQAMLAPA